jgi:hypothetical protein
MGLVGTITVVAPKDIREKKWLTSGIKKVDLDKAWVHLQGALDEIDRSLQLTLRGDRPMTDDDDDCTHALVTPAVVKRISKALDAIPKKAFLTAIEADKKEPNAKLQAYHDGWVKELCSRFNDLKAAYRLAAKEDAYIEIFIS